jgi:hypothetical protein
MWLDSLDTFEIAKALGVPEWEVWAITKPKPEPKIIPFSKVKK